MYMNEREFPNSSEYVKYLLVAQDRQDLIVPGLKIVRSLIVCRILLPLP